MSPFQAVYYRASDGNEPVRELLWSLDKKRRGTRRALIRLHKNANIALGTPPMPRQPKHTRDQSPIGTPVAEDIHASLDDAEIRAEHERLAPFEGLARLVIMRRAALGISQQQLAKRMHTTASAISRIESGAHATNARTLMRLADALDARAILGFEYGPPAKPERELVVL